ncbi:MAG: molybdenum cofactor biosynthesis protein MoaE [Acidimicrobiia bacterium]|nr:molybdenum cofactor biosynthesis protein MoaE [Acidimicrobiia bacterium]MBP8179863.1 molybdenum cofactor biosynthesis protein MoaE [Acidimicrobiia bacterium]
MTTHREQLLDPRFTEPGPERWIELSEVPLSVDEAFAWAAEPGCGAVVLFVGTVRDHADGRTGVTKLTYEAYESEAIRRMQAVADAVLNKWPRVRRLAILHRTGDVGVTEPAVIVAAAAAHRPEVFEAASEAIDLVKATVPLWKKEHHDGGVDWGTCAHALPGDQHFDHR